MNIVQVKLLENTGGKRYTYNVPENETLLKGDTVMVRNANGSKHLAICETNSERLTSNVVDMIMNGQRVLSDVIGVFTFRPFTTEQDDDVVVTGDLSELPFM